MLQSDILLSIVVAECGVESVMDNAYIVSKFEQYKLELNEDKCHQMHVGKSIQNCPTLKSHDEEMDVVLLEKYLGDIVTFDLFIYLFYFQFCEHVS